MVYCFLSPIARAVISEQTKVSRASLGPLIKLIILLVFLAQMGGSSVDIDD